MFTDWVLGVIFRPGTTFLKARKHLRGDFWWIFLSVATLETVIGIFASPDRDEFIRMWDSVATFQVMFLLMLLSIQALSLLAAARMFRWELPWSDAVKYVGLTWSVLLVEDIVTFIPAILGKDELGIRLSAGFVVWSIVALGAGVRRIARMPFWQALLLSAMALGPLRLLFFWLYYTG